MRWLLVGNAPCVACSAAAARSHASDLKLLFSRSPRDTLSHRLRKKVASYAGVQLKRGARLSRSILAAAPSAPMPSMSSSDIATGETETLVPESAG
jgi:hypothetical protein